MNARDRIIVALDVPSAEEAVTLVGLLKDRVGGFKVGLELFHAEGPAIFTKIHEAGIARIFYDAKLHDIPNTVARTCRILTSFGVWMANVHAAGGVAMMKAAVDAAQESARRLGVSPPKIVAVTLLTSIGALELAEELRVDCSVTDYVVYLARSAKRAGCDGVVCSPHEVPVVRWACGPEFLVVTPGVRPTWAEAGDQKRVMTPAEAVKAGSDYVVVGRPITAAPNPAEAADRIAQEITVGE